ncbi:MAG: hypothetical protein R2712_23265 [Vicinamibacterales bacterium]
MGRRLSEGQLQLFFLLASIVVRYRPEGLARLTDADVAEGSAAMATTLEAASRGVIAEVAGATPLPRGLRRQLDAPSPSSARRRGRYARDAAEVLLAGSNGGPATTRPASARAPTTISPCCAGCCPHPRATSSKPAVSPSGIIIP